MVLDAIEREMEKKYQKITFQSREQILFLVNDKTFLKFSPHQFPFHFTRQLDQMTFIHEKNWFMVTLNFKWRSVIREKFFGLREQICF